MEFFLWSLYVCKLTLGSRRVQELKKPCFKIYSMLKLDTEWYNLSEKDCTSKYWQSGTAQIVCPWDK